MTFSMYALLGEEASTCSNESLAEELEAYLRDEKEFFLGFERLPFSSSETLALRWGSWLVRMAYEEGSGVVHDSCRYGECHRLGGSFRCFAYHSSSSTGLQ